MLSCCVADDPIGGARPSASKTSKIVAVPLKSHVKSHLPNVIKSYHDLFKHHSKPPTPS